MKLSQKLAAVQNAHANSVHLEYGARLLLLSTLAKDLGLKLWTDMGVFEIKHPKYRTPLLTLKA